MADLDNMGRKTRIDRFSVSNGSSRELTLYLEPWGDLVKFPSGSKFEVQAVGPEGGFLEIVWGSDGVTIYGWTGSMVSVLAEGKEVLGSYGLPAPPLPGSSEAEIAEYMKLLNAKRAADQ